MANPVVERVKTGVLLALVALSLVLSAQVWFAPSAMYQPRGYKPTFLSPGARGDLTRADVIKPVAGMSLYFDGGPAVLGPGDEELIRFLWQGITELALYIPPSEFRDYDPEQVQQFYDGAGGVTGAEAALPGSMTLDTWRRLWWSTLDQPDPGISLGWDAAADVVIDRVAVFFDDRYAHVLVRTLTGHLGKALPLAVLNAGSSGATVASLQRILPTAISASGETAQQLESVDGLRVAGSVFASMPSSGPPLLQLGPPDLNWDLLASTFYPNLAVARRLLTGDIRIYTDGVTSLSIRPDSGLVEYQAPSAMQGDADARRGPQPAPSLLQALDIALNFGNEHGGWPEGTFLQQITPLRPRGSWEQLDQVPEPTGYRFKFGVRFNGLPVDGLDLAEVEVGPGGVALWRRHFRVNLLSDQIALRLQPAAAAVRRVGQLSPQELPLESRLLRHIHLAYSSFGDEFVKPAWLLYMHDGTRVRVDAWNAENFVVVEP